MSNGEAGAQGAHCRHEIAQMSNGEADAQGAHCRHEIAALGSEPYLRN
ncbi:hypothetical protein L195_g038250 [Trifolium pratense]|uniref:Uncharacterized protein n=1 Tax=Trifolium pratense TaxID=57577 RepID=A0A2K3LUK4_TRIPR|nr:hypothetical protein L195_g038250 [Trifolium pratense]